MPLILVIFFAKTHLPVFNENIQVLTDMDANVKLIRISYISCITNNCIRQMETTQWLPIKILFTKFSRYAFAQS